jgi:hypothetical protein
MPDTAQTSNMVTGGTQMPNAWLRVRNRRVRAAAPRPGWAGPRRPDRRRVNILITGM